MCVFTLYTYIYIYKYKYVLTHTHASMGRGVVRLRSQPPHKCSCCGKVGHNIRQCKAPGAQELLHLRASMQSLMKQQPMKRFKNRVPVKVVNNKSGKGKHQASKEYGTYKNQTVGTREFAHKHMSDSVVDILDTDSGKAYKELVDFGFIHVPDVCPDCKHPVGGPVPFKSCPGKLYFRCRSYQCGKRFNVTDFSVFRGIRLSLVALCRVITFCSRCNVLKAPLVSDAQAQLRISRKPVEHAFNALLAEEAKAGERHNKVKHRLSGELEADGHGLRKLYVSPHNQHFSAEIEDAITRYRKANPGKKLPSYWKAHLRVVGVKKRMAKAGYRSGKGVFQVLPFKLVPPAASPPVESKKEIQDSKVLDQIVKATDTRVRLYSDGAPAWPSLCDVKGIKNFQVKHNKFEFVKRLPGMKKPASVVLAGTQVIDRWWQAMDAFIPPQIHNKKGKGGPVNDRLKTYAHAWVWRYHLPVGIDFKTELGKIC